MAEGIGPGQNEVQPEELNQPEGSELKPNPEHAGQVKFMQENSRPGTEQPWSTGRVASNEQADDQIGRAMEGLRAKVSPELYERVVQAGGKPDGEFKTQVANELRQAIGDEAFNQFNADTTVSRPLDLSTLSGASPKVDRNRPSEQANRIEDTYLNNIGYRPAVSSSADATPANDNPDYDRGER